MFKYQIITDKGLILRHFTGRQDIESIYDSIIKTAEDYDYDPFLNVLNDIRDAFIVFDQDSIGELVNKIRTNSRIYGSRKVAFLTDSPNQVVFGMFVDRMKRESLIDIRIASTFNTALNHLNISKQDFLFIENQMSDLKSL